MAKKEKAAQAALNKDYIEDFIQNVIKVAENEEEARDMMAFHIEGQEIDAHTTIECGLIIENHFRK